MISREINRPDVSKNLSLTDDNNEYGFYWIYNQLDSTQKNFHLSYLDSDNKLIVCLNRPIVFQQQPKKIEHFEISEQCIGNIDEISKDNTNLKIRGWMAQEENNLPIEESIGISYKVDNQTYFYEINKNQRKDVTEHFGFADLDNQLYGFESTHDIPKNSTDFHLSYMNGNTTRICKNPSLSM